jgi:ABC-type multidrug transport system ATPase subunit
VISLRGVTKVYRPLLGRRVLAVDDVTLDVAAGEVVGIAGPNGAGKSTIISLLLGFLRPSAGSLSVGGLAPREYVERHGVAFQPELMALPKTWTVDRALTRLAVLAGVPAPRVRAEVARSVGALAIGEHRRKRVKALSKGNFQRLGLAQALLDDQRVFIFDEPTHGLDPVWTQRFRDIVTRLRRSDRAIFIASHNLDELERVCDRVAIIDRGRIQRMVVMKEAAGAEARAYRARVVGDAAALVARFPGAVVLPGGEVDLPAVTPAELNAGLRSALADGVQLVSLTPRESTLEAAFHSAVGGAS